MNFMNIELHRNHLDEKCAGGIHVESNFNL